MKKGLDFFPFDVDFFEDEKIQYVSARFGSKGEASVIRLLTRIYRNGYYMYWNDDTGLLFSTVARIGDTSCLANSIVQELVKRGFFDKSLFDSFGVLTSAGIQRRYLDACKRRISVEMEEDFILIDDLSKWGNVHVLSSGTPKKGTCRHAVYISDENVDISNKNVNISPQSKVKESKVNKSIEDRRNISIREAREHRSLSPSFSLFLEKVNPTPSPTLIERLGQLIDDYGDDEVSAAIAYAVEVKKTHINYIEGVLKGRREDGARGKRDTKSRRKVAGDAQSDTFLDTLREKYKDSVGFDPDLVDEFNRNRGR